MSSWPAIVTAVLSAGIALAGVIYTQRRADRREADRRTEDDRREETRRAREDALRSYEHRRAAYADFAKTWEGYVSVIDRDAELGGYSPEGSDWDNLESAWTQVRIVGTTKAAASARAAMEALRNRAERNTPLDRTHMDRYLSEIRRDLALPE